MTEQPPAPTLTHLHVAAWAVDGHGHCRAGVDLAGLQQFAGAIGRAGHPVSVWRVPVEPTRWQWLDGDTWRRYRLSLAVPLTHRDPHHR